VGDVNAFRQPTGMCWAVPLPGAACGRRAGKDRDGKVAA